MTLVTTVDPRALFQRLAHELPHELLNRVFVVGSLAAACHHTDRLKNGGVKTKDADLVLHPAGDETPAQEIARLLRARGWRHRRLGGFEPGTRETPAAQLPAIRLYPPEHEDYFIELLILPSGERPGTKAWLQVELEEGYFGLPSFEFLALTSYDRCCLDGALEYAQPSMMALANLLSHPELDDGPPMSTRVANRDIHRSSKDLGRVLALTWLEPRDEVDTWSDRWERALRVCFPTRWSELAARVGSGLRALLEDIDRFDEAWHCCNDGLLSGHGVTHDQLRATADQLMGDVIVLVEQLARSAPTLAS